MAATHTNEYSVFDPVLYLAFELGSFHWKLGFTTGLGQRPRERNIVAGDLEALQDEIKRAKKRFSLAEKTKVVSCYEAGRDGFWTEQSCLKLVFATLWQASQRWQGVRMSEFEQQQLIRLRSELSLLPPGGEREILREAA